MKTLEKNTLKLLKVNRSDYNKAYIDIESILLDVYNQGRMVGKKEGKKLLKILIKQL